MTHNDPSSATAPRYALKVYGKVPFDAFRLCLFQNAFELQEVRLDRFQPRHVLYLMQESPDRLEPLLRGEPLLLRDFYVA
jgi:hypothetical protein